MNMSAAVLINSGVVIFRSPWGNKVTFRWWADGGLIHNENQMTGEYACQTVGVTLVRLKAIQDMIGNSRTGRGYMYPDECRQYQEYVDQMIELCKTARSQGMPDDPAVAKQKVDEMRAKRQSRMIMLPGLHSNARF